jgi:hypothetical protein
MLLFLTGCEVANLPFFSQGDGACEHQGDCAEDLILGTIQGGNHSWPSGAPPAPIQGCEGGAQSQTFELSPLLFYFFLSHHLP